MSNGGSVTLEATPNDGFRFSGYSGDPLCTGTEPRLTLSGVTRDIQCTANFSELQRFRVGVARMGESNAGDLLTGVVQPSGATCAAPECSVPAGQSLVLTSATRDLPLLNHGWTCTNLATGAVQQSTEGDVQTMTITLQGIDADWNCESDIETLAN